MRVLSRRILGATLMVSAALAGMSVKADDAVKVRGANRAWEPLTLDITGPRASEHGEPNPFLDLRVTATFTQGDARYEVPGYFAADGDAAETRRH